jgi:ATP-dependent metalloprotease
MTNFNAADSSDPMINILIFSLFFCLGASSDIDQATKVARAMVTKFGMSSKVGPVMHGDSEFSSLSSKTRTEIENEVKLLIETARQRALNILKTHKDELQALAKALLEYETLSKEEIEQVIKGKVLTKRIEEQAQV